MSHFGRIIRAQRAERGWSQQDLADRAGLHRNTINKVERTFADPDHVQQSTLVCLAHGFGLSVDELTGLYRRPRVPQQQGDPGGGIPVINKAPAGPPIDYEDLQLDSGVGSDYIPRLGSGVHDPTAFAFVVVGDSMEPEFREGDTVVCSPQADINDGDAVFVRFGSAHDHACTFKRVYDNGNHVTLVPDNRRHKPLEANKDDIDRMAKAVAKWVRY